MWSRTFGVGMSGACWPIFKSDHQVMDCLLNSRDFDWDEVGNGNLSIFWLSDVEGPRALLIVKIVDFFVVDFVEGNEYFGIGLIFKSFHDHFQRSGENSSLLAGKEVVNILLVTLTERSAGVRWRRVITNDGVGLTSPCLSVCKNCYVGAQQKLINWLFQKVEYVLLGRVIRQNVTEPHASEISRSLDEKGFVILKFDEFCLLLLIENRADSD